MATDTRKKKRSASSGNRKKTSGSRKMSARERARRKRKRIVLFVLEIFVLLLMVVVLYGVLKTEKVGKMDLKEENIVINEELKQQLEVADNEEVADGEPATGAAAMKGYRNIALFGVDSTTGELTKKTRSDTIIIASINQDTGECKLVSVYRDTYLNLGNDSYNKCNAAYAKGGPEQAINMLNMNLDMNITDYVTVGFDGLIQTIDAIGGVYIDVQENEIVHLNNYQISMVGKTTDNKTFTATEGVDYTAVKEPGYQLLNGLQATAYCRIRYVGNDFARAQRENSSCSCYGCM